MNRWRRRPTNADELRKHTRASFSSELHVRLPDGQEIEGRARDISLGGMFVLTDTPPAFGVSVTVLLPVGARVLQLPAVVRWSGAGGIGVQFGALGVVETHHITELTREGTPPSIRSAPPSSR